MEITNEETTYSQTLSGEEVLEEKSMVVAAKNGEPVEEENCFFVLGYN
jgi:hypothetical protein